MGIEKNSVYWSVKDVQEKSFEPDNKGTISKFRSGQESISATVRLEASILQLSHNAMPELQCFKIMLFEW